ncbi:MAG: HEAT repeat domain-containing protein [Actinomycetales bacterium]
MQNQNFPAGVFIGVFAAFAVVIVLLAATIVVGRLWRHQVVRHRAVVAEDLRLLVIQAAAGTEEEAATAANRLVELDPTRWRAIAPTITTMLVTVRGESRSALIEVLARRGTLVDALRSLGTGRRGQRARAIELLSTCDVASSAPEIIRALQDPAPQVRQVAARALGRLRTPAAVAPLFATVGSNRPVPPRVIATAISRIGVQAHPELKLVLASPNAEQRAVAAEVCGLVGASGTLGMLTQMLEHDPSLEVRIRAARSLGKIGLPWVVPHLVSACQARHPAGLRSVAARALGEIGSPEALAALSRLATDPHDRLAVNASYALTQVGTEGFASLLRLAEDPGHVQAREAVIVATLRGETDAPAWWSREDVE